MKLIQSRLRWATLSNTRRRWFCETIRFSRGNNCEVNADDSVSSPCLDNHTCCARWCPAVLAYALHVCMWGAPSCVFSRIKGTVHVSAYSSHVCMTCRGDIQRLHVLVFYSFKVFTCCKWFDTRFCNMRCKIIILVISPSSSFYMLITTIYWSVKLSLWAEMPFNRITVCGLHYTWTLHNIRSHFFQPPVWPNLTTPPAQVVSVLSELTWRLRRSGEYGSVSGSPWFCPWGWAGNEVGHTVSETINCFLIKSVLQAFSVQGSDLRGGDGGCIWSLSWCLTPLKAKKNLEKLCPLLTERQNCTCIMITFKG